MKHLLIIFLTIPNFLIAKDLILVCDGERKKETKITGTFEDEIEIKKDIRTYILKNDRVIDGFIYQPSHSDCKFNEHKIKCEDSVDSGSNYLEIDRKTGKLLEIARVYGAFTISFEGMCKKADKNLF